MLHTIEYTAIVNKVKIIVRAEYSGTYGEVEAIYTPHDNNTNIKNLLSKATAKIIHDKLQIRIHDLNAAVDPMIAPNLMQYLA